MLDFLPADFILHHCRRVLFIECTFSVLHLLPDQHKIPTRMDSDSNWDDCSVFSLSPSLSSYDDCDESIYSYSSHWSLDYWTWPADAEVDYCSCCGNLPYDTLLAIHCEKDNDYTSWKFAPYRDLRSAARSQRPRKRQDRRMCHSYKCRKQGQAYADQRNIKSKREIKKYAVRENQKESIKWTKDGRVATYRHMEWDIHEPEEFDEEIMEMSETEQYTIFNHHADVFESPEPYTEVGEDFSTWCQRRIAEMRAVKESRIHAKLPATVKPMIWHRKQDGNYLRRYDIYCGDETTTTLPTNAYDAYGHELLRGILTPSRWWMRKHTVSQASLFQPINGFRWFGEYEWCWYRDETGNWEIGYGGNYYNSRHVKADACPYCCGGLEERIVGAGEECCCGGSGRKQGPEEVQRCWIVEWVGEEGREIVRRDEQARNTLLGGKESGSQEQDDVWEVCSNVSSDTWSVVDTVQ